MAKVKTWTARISMYAVWNNYVHAACCSEWSHKQYRKASKRLIVVASIDIFQGNIDLRHTLEEPTCQHLEIRHNLMLSKMAD